MFWFTWVWLVVAWQQTCDIYKLPFWFSDCKIHKTTSKNVKLQNFANLLPLESRSHKTRSYFRCCKKDHLNKQINKQKTEWKFKFFKKYFSEQGEITLN